MFTKITARHVGGTVAAVVFIGTILLANYVIERFGFIPVGFGLTAAAGVFVAGFTLATRDIVQDLLGRGAIVILILIGTGISFAVASPQVAIASATAFLIAETLNFLVYTPLRERSKLGDRRWAAAVSASNLVAAIADTVVFLGIAFGWAIVLPQLPGQLLGKLWATLIYLVVGALIGQVIKARRARTEPAVA